MSDATTVPGGGSPHADERTSGGVTRSKTAVFSLAISIFGAVSLPVLFCAPCLVGIAVGVVALHRIRAADRQGRLQRGRGLALAGIVVGGLFLALGVVYLHANPCLYRPNQPACTDKYPG